MVNFSKFPKKANHGIKKFMDLYEKTIDQLENSSSENINYVFVRDKNSIRRTRP